MLEASSENTSYLLANNSLFKGLGITDLEWLSARSYKRAFPAGTVVVLAGQPAEALYIILSGTVKIHIEHVNGRDVVLSIIGAGDLVGEISLLDNVGHSATAVTLENSQLLWMDKPTFLYALATFPQVGQNLSRILASRLRMNNELIHALGTMDVYGRVARQLLAFAEKYGENLADGSTRIILSFTQGDMMDLVGAARRSVGLAMGSFRQQKYISMDTNGKMIVHNRVALAKYCV